MEKVKNSKILLKRLKILKFYSAKERISNCLLIQPKSEIKYSKDSDQSKPATIDKEHNLWKRFASLPSYQIANNTSFKKIAPSSITSLQSPQPYNHHR